MAATRPELELATVQSRVSRPAAMEQSPAAVDIVSVLVRPVNSDRQSAVGPVDQRCLGQRTGRSRTRPTKRDAVRQTSPAASPSDRAADIAYLSLDYAPPRPLIAIYRSVA